MDGLRTRNLLFLAIILGLLAGCAGSTASTPTPSLRPAPAASTPATLKAVQTALPTATATASEPATPTMPALEAGAVRRDVTYCLAGDTELKTDLYAPRAGSNRPAPAVIYVHGGGWVSGDKSATGPIGVVVDELLKRGYFVAAIDYRLAPKHRWPAQIQDVKCAVRHLRENSSTYRLDPDRIGMWGASAGGHLAGLAGLADASAGLDGEGGYPASPAASRRSWTCPDLPI